MENTLPKRKTTFIGILLMAYFSLIACANTQMNIYGGFVALTGSIIIENLFSKDRLKVNFPLGCKLYYYFVIFCFFSRFWAINLYQVKNLSQQLIAVLLLIAIPTHYFIKKQNPAAPIAAIACVGVVLSCYVIYREGGLSAFYSHATSGRVRIGSEITNVNRIGMAASLSTVVLISYGMLKKKRWCFVPAVITFMAASASGSRKSILILIVGVFFLILLSQKDKQSIVKFFKIIIAIIISIVVFKMLMSLDIMYTVKERMDGLIASLTGDSFNSDHSANSRMNMIEFGWSQFKERPFLGVGVGNSKELHWRHFGSYMYLHNDYIEQLVNGGILGFLLYYGNVFYIAVRHIKLMKIKKDAEIVVSFVVLMMFLVMNTACVTYYDFLQTALYFILWITTIEVKKIEYAQTENDLSIDKGDGSGTVRVIGGGI